MRKTDYSRDRLTRSLNLISPATTLENNVDKLYQNIVRSFATSVAKPSAYNAHYIAVKELRAEAESLPPSDHKDHINAALIYLENFLRLETNMPVFEPLTDIQRSQLANIVVGITERDLSIYCAAEKRFTVNSDRFWGKYYPRMSAIFSDLERSLDAFVIQQSHSERLCDRNTLIVTVGSCFAENVSKFLQAQGYSVINLASPEEASPVTLHKMATVLASGQGKYAPYSERIRSHESVCIVFTAGVGEMLHLKDGTIVPASSLKAAPLKIRSVIGVDYISPETILENLGNAFDVFRQMNPNSRMICTVSPVPMEASFNRLESIITANAISKAALLLGVRKACDQFPEFTYFPSYEIVKDWAVLARILPFGADDGHPRHVSKNLVAIICLTFIKRFFGQEEFAATLARMGADSLDLLKDAVWRE